MSQRDTKDTENVIARERSDRSNLLSAVKRLLRYARNDKKGYFQVKLIEAIIPPSRLQTIKEALNEIGVVRLTVSDVEGFDNGKGREETLQGKDYTVETLRKVKIEIAVNEAFVKPTIDCILRAGKVAEECEGVGKIFVLPLEDVIRIRTGERGPDAI